MMSVLDQLSERHIECFRSILGKLFRGRNSITKINLFFSQPNINDQFWRVCIARIER